MRHGWATLFKRYRDLETNAATQYRVHTIMQRVWIVWALVMDVVWIASFFVSSRWLVVITSFIAIVTNQISFYANWGTDNGAAAAAKSVMQTDHTYDQLQNQHEEILDAVEELQHADI